MGNEQEIMKNVKVIFENMELDNKPVRLLVIYISNLMGSEILRGDEYLHTGFANYGIQQSIKI